MSRFNEDHMAESMGAGLEEAASAEAATPAPARSAQHQGVKKLKNSGLIPIDRIKPDPNQPRKQFDQVELERLADTIRDRGLLQAIRVRWDDLLEHYVIIAGERRWQACRMAGVTAIEALIETSKLDDGNLLVDQLIENCTREDLNPVEQAEAYKAMMDKLGMSQDQVAKKIGISAGHVSKMLSILKLNETTRQQLIEGKISLTKAYSVARAENPKESTLLKGKVSKFIIPVETPAYKASVEVKIVHPDLPESAAITILDLARHHLMTKGGGQRSREAG